MEYSLRSGYSAMDFGRVTEMLAKAPWSPGIGIAEVEQGARHSALVVGSFDGNGRQIGFARVISDRTRFAYILDVMVDETCRKQGLGQAMVKYILAHPDLKDVYQWLLITENAHEVYKKVGFAVTRLADEWMEIRKPREARSLEAARRVLQPCRG